MELQMFGRPVPENSNLERVAAAVEPMASHSELNYRAFAENLRLDHRVTEARPKSLPMRWSLQAKIWMIR